VSASLADGLIVGGCAGLINALTAIAPTIEMPAVKAAIPNALVILKVGASAAAAQGAATAIAIMAMAPSTLP
jgi:hypothetical protein